MTRLRIPAFLHEVFGEAHDGNVARHAFAVERFDAQGVAHARAEHGGKLGRNHRAILREVDLAVAIADDAAMCTACGQALQP